MSVNKVKDFSKIFYWCKQYLFHYRSIYYFLRHIYPLILKRFQILDFEEVLFYNKVFAPLAFNLFILGFSTYSIWSRDIPLIGILKSSTVIFALTILSSIAIIFFLNNYEWWLIGGIFFGNLILIRYIVLIIDSVIFKKYFDKGLCLHIGFALLIISISLNAALSSETFSMSVGDEVS